MAEIIHSEINKNILSLDATELAERIKTKDLTSEEVTTTYINHIKTINPVINAVVESRFNDAIEEAKQMDATSDQYHDKPLYGVPISIKESFNVSGMKTTGGIIHRQDIIKSRDAITVQKLKDAGAIVLCKTNTPALCFCQETDNKLYGRTNNPWNIKHTAGGSSGGEAALLSVGGAAVGLGSDIGGSIRFPSHFNGVVGFKSGKNEVSSEGHFPPSSHDLQERMLGIGAIGKTVRDAELIYNLTTEKQEKKSLFEKMQIEILPADSGYPLGNETESIMNDITQFISSYYDVEKTIPPYFSESALLWQEIMAVDGGQKIKEIAFNTDRANLWRTYLREKTLGNTETHSYLSWALIGANLFKPSKKRVNEIEQLLNAGDKVLSGYLNNRILIFPVYHRSAPRHGDLYKEIFSINKTFLKFMPYVAYANVWGLPSLTIPIGFDKHNLPVGMQIMSKVGNEKAIFKLGKELEERFSGYQQSNPIK